MEGINDQTKATAGAAFEMFAQLIRTVSYHVYSDYNPAASSARDCV